MKILVLGDIITPTAVTFLSNKLWAYRKAHQIDLVIVNAENASFLAGISTHAAETLLKGGVDVLTGGNHTMQTRSTYSYLDSEAPILRPINFPEDVPGKGFVIVDCLGKKVLVMNAMGTVMMEPSLNSPYPYIEHALKDVDGEYDYSILDFHAESTGEKIALGMYFDGKFSFIFGTHTHVPTRDARILPHGTGYITDIGATYPLGGVLGMDYTALLDRLKSKIPTPYKMAQGPIMAQGAIFTLHDSMNTCLKIETVTIKEGRDL